MIEAVVTVVNPPTSIGVNTSSNMGHRGQAETTEKVLQRYGIISSRRFWILPVHYLEYRAGVNPGRIKLVLYPEYSSGANPGRIKMVLYPEYSSGANPGRVKLVYYLEYSSGVNPGRIKLVEIVPDTCTIQNCFSTWHEFLTGF